ncbi:hypothetical protein [Nonomuraea sp. NPDC049400]|uniref:hypothetical protein n=1 Tax=Nonomuraea sp. NPDC049400 TaxID=3364352 RepID=UPI0037B59BE1
MAPPPQHQEAPERKSSKAVALTVVGALSVTLVAVWAIAESNDDDDVTADCVILVEDDTSIPTDDFTTATPTPIPGSYQVVDDSYCEDDDGHSSYRFSSGNSHGAYHWYYGGTRRGDRVYDGTTYRPSDVNISSRSGKDIQRGGFGNRWSSGS